MLGASRRKKVVVTRQEKEQLRKKGDIRGHFAFLQRGRPPKVPRRSADASAIDSAGSKRPKAAAQTEQMQPKEKKQKRVHKESWITSRAYGYNGTIWDRFSPG